MTLHKLHLATSMALALLLSIPAGAQESDPIQDTPSYLELRPAASQYSNKQLAPRFETGASQSKGWPNQLMTEANRLRRETVFVPGRPPDRMLRLGDTGQDVQWLIQALTAHGYLAAGTYPARYDQEVGGSLRPGWENDTSGVAQSGTAFDAGVEIALRAFQVERGLSEDGVAGKVVYAALQVDNSALANALESWAENVAHWADQARAAGHDRMIVVNVPSFTLHAIDLTTNEEVIQSRVIVGQPRTRTPLMMTRVTNLKANPDWSPPKSIRGARYQRPGPNNALGLMRFSTDNTMNIYLHDTNARELFEKDRRALSHGCIRVQQWQPLAAWAAEQDERWVDEVALAGGKTRFLKVDAIPVVIAYSLVDFVEGHGRQFDDVYNKGSMAIGYGALKGTGDGDLVPWTQWK